MRGQLSLVCRDCGDVNHFDPSAGAPGVCASCGLSLGVASSRATENLLRLVNKSAGRASSGTRVSSVARLRR